MNAQSFLSSQEFQKLHPVKQQVIKELLKSGQFSSPEALLPKFMSLNQELGKRNLNFTKEETTLLIGLLKEEMSPQDRKKVDLLLGMFYR